MKFANMEKINELINKNALCKFLQQKQKLFAFMQGLVREQVLRHVKKHQPQAREDWHFRTFRRNESKPS